MKIIKDGKILGTTVRTKCDCCDCIFEYDDQDLILSNKSKLLKYKLCCPYCKQDIDLDINGLPVNTSYDLVPTEYKRKKSTVDLVLNSDELKELKEEKEVYVNRNEKEYIVIETGNRDCPFYVYEAWDLEQNTNFTNNLMKML